MDPLTHLHTLSDHFHYTPLYYIGNMETDYQNFALLDHQIFSIIWFC
jgi:hypothetical protein